MSESDFNKIPNRLVDLPINENFNDETGPEYMTSVVWEPMEHFIHNPERTLTEYGWSKHELKQVNWPAIKIAWQRLWKRWYEQQGEYKIFLGDEGWDPHPKERILNFGNPPEPEEYDPLRNRNPKAIKAD